MKRLARVIGSGLVRSREEQMQILARNMARRIQLWMLQNPEWFSIDPEAAAEDAAEIAAIAAAEEPDIDTEALEEQTEACLPTDEVACPEPAEAAIATN